MDHEVVTECVCSDNKKKQLKWYDGEIPELCCNICRNLVKTTTVQESQNCNQEIPDFNLTLGSPGLVSNQNYPFGNIAEIKTPLVTIFADQIIQPTIPNIQIPQIVLPSSALSTKDDPDKSSDLVTVPVVPMVPLMNPFSIIITAPSLGPIATKKVNHAWLRDIGINIEKTGCQVHDSNVSDSCKVSLCLCGRVYSGKCEWGIWTSVDQCTCNDATVAWYKKLEMECNYIRE